MPPRLTTPRLILRPFTPEDIDAAFVIFESHPDVWKYDPGHARSYDQRAAIITKYASLNDPKGEGTLAVTLKEDGQLIGYVGLQLYILPAEPLATPEVELFYKLGREHWNQGYAFEACHVMLDYAFDQLRIKRIVTVTSRENNGSIRLLTRLGFRIQDAPREWAGDVLGVLDNPYHAGSSVDRNGLAAA
jgi:RimJ/RimL family protein N-acetyltransferase